MKIPQHTPNENSVKQVAQTQKKTVLQKLKDAFFNKYTFVLIAALSSCTTDSVEEKDNTFPIAKIGNHELKDVDGNGIVDAVFDITATDNKGVEAVDFSVDGQYGVAQNGKYVVLDVSAGERVAKLEVTDTSGNKTSDTKKFMVDPENEAPTVSEIKNLVVDDATNTISFDIDGTDTDGEIKEYQVTLNNVDGTKLDLVTDADGKFNKEITEIGTYNGITYAVQDEDGANSEEKTKTIDFTVEAPDNLTTVANPTITVDENTTTNLDPQAEDLDGLATAEFGGEGVNQLAEYFDIIDKGVLKLKAGKVLNHEAQPIISGIMKYTDVLGNVIEKTITVELNDLDEETIIDVFGDDLLPNGVAYGITTDEDEGMTVLYYNHGSSRRTAAAIQAELDNSSSGYGNAESDMYNLYGTNIGPKFANGQIMVRFDAPAKEVVILAEDGSESARIDRSLYGSMMAQIKVRVGINDNVNFVQDGTILHTIWTDMIVLQATNPSDLYGGVDRAIQNHLAE